MAECELKWCIGKEKDLTISVNENIGDECYNVEICLECAYVLGMCQGQDLPETHIVENKLKGHAKSKKEKKAKTENSK